jgi:hypothetical protein
VINERGGIRTGAAGKITVSVKFGSLSERNLTETVIFGLDRDLAVTTTYLSPGST